MYSFNSSFHTITLSVNFFNNISLFFLSLMTHTHTGWVYKDQKVSVFIILIS